MAARAEHSIAAAGGTRLAWLEARFHSSGFDVRNLIDVGIIEMLPGLPEGEQILSMLPADLRARAEVAGLFQG